MDPADRRDRVRSNVLDYINSNAWKRHEVIEEAQRQTTKMVAAQIGENGSAGLILVCKCT